MQWFENETFWETFYDFMFGEARTVAAPMEVEQVLKLSGVSQGKVLDLCCGPARHSALLAERAFEVTAVDRSAFLLGKARARAAGLNIEFVESDMREFVRPGTYDLILNLFTSFGYFETRAEDFKVLENVRASLKPGGVFILDILGKEYLAARPSSTLWDQQDDTNLMIHHFDVLPGWDRIKIQWVLVKNGKTHWYEFFQNLYSGQELVMLLQKVGFEKVELFGDLEGSPYDKAAKRLVVRAS